MKLLLKVYEHQFDDTVITQEIINSEVVIEEDIKTFSIATFRMPLIKIEEYNIVEIYEVWNTDKRIFRGYVYEIKPIWRQFGEVDIVCRGEKAIFNDRCVLSDKNYEDQDIKVILEDLLADYIPYWEDWLLEVDFIKDITLELKEWDDYFGVLDELADQCEAEWTIIDKKVLFKRNIWIDRSTGVNYQEITYNWLFPNNSNIWNIDVIGTATRYNVVIGRWEEKTRYTANWFIDRLYWVKFEDFRDWDLEEKTEKELENSNRNQRVYQVVVEQNTINANIWDKIRLIVENTNSFYDIDSSVYVISKTTRYFNGSKTVNYSLWELNLRIKNIENWLYWIQKDIKLLKL